MVPVDLQIHMPLDLEPDPNNMSSLKSMAGFYYSMSYNNCSIADMTKHPLFKVVPLRTLENWSADDDWVARRRDTQASIQQYIQQSVSKKIAEDRVAQLQKLQNIYDKGIDMLLANKLKAKSFEGLLTAITKVATLMDDWRARMAIQVGGVVEGGAADGAQQTAAPSAELSMQEARSLVKLLFQMRRVSAEEA